LIISTGINKMGITFTGGMTFGGGMAFTAAGGGGGGGPTQRAIFGYGYSTDFESVTNKVSSTGVVATDTTGVGTARNGLAAAGYGGDKAIFG
jgi:hypothetical protein